MDHFSGRYAPYGRRKIKDVVKRVERIMLPAGKYQLYPNISSPQITPYPSFPGDKRVEMWVKSTNSFMSQGGGVRIKEIRQTDGNGNTIVSQYDYTQESGMSSGLMMYPLRFSRNKLQVYQAEAGPGHSEGGSSIDPVPPAAVLKTIGRSGRRVWLPSGGHWWDTVG